MCPSCKKRAHSRRIELARHQAGGKKRFDFGSKYQLAAGLVHVERLDPQAVAPKNQFAFARIPNRKRKHAAQFFDEAFAVFQIEMKNDFRVRSGAEGMAALLEFGAQFARRCSVSPL